MPSVRLLTLLLIVTLPAMAQTDKLQSRSSETIDGISGVEGGAAVASLPSAPTPEPVAHRVIDKKFIFVMSALGATESIRFTSRKLVLDNEFAAGAPWVTHVTPNQNLVAKYGALYAAELLVAYEMKKPHSWLPGDRAFRKLWWAYPAAMATVHLKNGIGNIRTQGPGGCTSIQCAMQTQ